MSSLEFLASAILIAISAFMSASEVALFSLSRFQLRALKERSIQAHRNIKRLLGDPGGLLVTILLVNEVVNISLSTLITQAVAREWKAGEDGGLSWVHSLMPSSIASAPEWLLELALGTLFTPSEPWSHNIRVKLDSEISSEMWLLYAAKRLDRSQKEKPQRRWSIER